MLLPCTAKVQSFRYSPELLSGDLVDGEHVSETPCPMLAGLLASIVMICLWIQVVITKLNNFEQFSLRTTIGLGFFEFEWRNHRLSALHQTLGEPVGVSNAAELYTNLCQKKPPRFAVMRTLIGSQTFTRSIAMFELSSEAILV